jgi:vancomycin resistance protein YoaR
MADPHDPNGSSQVLGEPGEPAPLGAPVDASLAPVDASLAPVDASLAPAQASSEPVDSSDVPVTEVITPVITQQVPSRRRRRLRIASAFVASFVAAAVIGSTVGAAAIYAYRSAYDGRIPLGVDVGGVDVSGLDAGSAESLVAASFASMTTGSIILDGKSSDRIIDFAEFGRSVDAASAVERAMGVAKDGDIVEQTLASARTAIDGVSVAPTVALDTELLAVAIDRAVRSYERPARDAVVTSTVDGIVLKPAQFGLVVDREAVLTQALEQLSRADAPSTITVPVRRQTVDPELTNEEAEAARQAVERMARQVVVRHGDEKWKIGANTVRSWIVVATDDGRIVYDIDREKVASTVEKLRSKIDRKPVNATYLTSKSGRIVGVKASRNGRKVDSAITSERLARAVISRAYGVEAESAKAVVASVTPKLTTAEAEKTAPLLKMISGHTTWFPYGERNFYGANIWIPGRIINGTVLAPGETFDFWKAVGIPSAARGFGMGGAIINGKTEPTGALAGGICSCSTTLFNAAANAGLKLGARRMHYYYIDRYPLGRDATVWISSSGGRQNLTFTNDTKYPILIVNRNWRVGSKGYIRFEMWSVPNGRKVRWSKPTVKNVRPATTSVVYTSALPPGVTRQDEFEHDGMDVWVTRTVTQNGKVVHKDTIYSHYARVDGLILKGR